MRPIRRNDNRIWVKFIYFFNELYNQTFRLIMGNLSNEIIQRGMHIAENDESILRANTSQTAWLLNIDRCFDMLSKTDSFKYLKLKNIRWIDVGCGNGLASVYVAAKYKIKTQLLFDFDVRCINYSKKKYTTLNNSLIGSLNKVPIPIFIHLDAAEDKLPDEFNGKNLFYLYNPFDDVILKKFLMNNFELINRGSIIFYLNDIYREVILETNELNLMEYRRNEFYEISIFVIGF